MTIAIYSSKELPEAGAYWGMRPREPLGSGQGFAFIAEGFDVKIDLLLSHLLHLLNPEDWGDWGGVHVLVGHGTNEAINLGLSAENPAVLRLKDLETLCKFVSGDVDGAVIKKKYKVDPDVLADTIDRFCTLSLRHVAVRACNIGSNDAYLLKLAELLNIKTISAPTRRDFFTGLYPKKVTEDPDPAVAARIIMKKAPKVINSYIVGEKNDIVMFNFEKGSRPTRFRCHAVASSEKAVNDFYRANFQFLNPVDFKWGMAVPLYGINMNHERLPLVPIFPNHPNYSSFLKVVNNPKFVQYPPPQINLPLYIPKDPMTPVRRRPLQKLFRTVFGR